MKQIISSVLVCLALIGGCGLGGLVQAEREFEALTIRTAGGREIVYEIEIADTDAERRKGLMYRQDMPTNRGMLLDFGKPEKVSIWMKNTLIPLDIIYIDDDGIIAKIVPDTVPHSTALMPSEGKIRAVLEVNAGQCAYHDIRIGDRVLHRAFR
jgi:hypothetical protein